MSAGAPGEQGAGARGDQLVDDLPPIMTHGRSEREGVTFLSGIGTNPPTGGGVMG